MTKKSLIERALAFATEAHAGQTDASGAPYILHPIAVADIVKDMHAKLKAQGLTAYSKRTVDEEAAAALLHDVIEDTKVQATDLVECFPDRVCEIVVILTRDKLDQVTYAEFIDDIIKSGNLGAMRVKLADLTHNSDPARIAKLPYSKRSIVHRYHKAKDSIITALSPLQVAEYLRGVSQ